ncbi:MAG TPA: hypothetical protein VNL14_11275 [Candidatus Acidoferrales bacterium]|nr:hypothetical protein [Candidatus Acidoferrales bacterium]
MRPFGVIVLAFCLLHAGVAHALATCLNDSEHAGHAGKAEAERHSHQGMSEERTSDHRDHPCHDLKFKLGPGSAGFFASYFSAALQLPVPNSLTTSEIGAKSGTDLWLRNVFWQFSGPSRLIGLSRHIFLSVLLI